MTRTSTATHSTEREAIRSTTRVRSLVSASASDASSYSVNSGRTIVFCFAKAFRPPPAPGSGTSTPVNSRDAPMMHQTGAGKQRPAARPTRARPGVQTPPGAEVLASVLVLAVVLVGLALFDTRGLPDEAAPLVGLAEQLERGE